MTYLEFPHEQKVGFVMGTKPAWANRIRTRRAELDNKSQLEIEAETDGVLYQRLMSRIENGTKNPIELEVSQFAAFLQSLKWTVDDFIRETGLEVPLIFPVLIAEAEQNRINAFGLAVNDHALPVGFHLAPIIGVASGGNPEAYPVPSNIWRRGTRVFEITGDSMTTGDPDSLRDGDWVYVDSFQTQLLDNKMFCVEVIGNGYTVKRARRLNGAWFLMSDNPLHASLKPDEARVIGQVYDAVGRRKV